MKELIFHNNEGEAELFKNKYIDKQKSMLISQVNCLAMDNLNTIKSSTGVKLNTSINNVNRPKSLSEIINKKPLPMINFLKKKKNFIIKGKI